MNRNSRNRRINLPIPSEVDSSALADLVRLLGYDDRASWTSIRINAHRVEVDLRPKPDVKITVVHPVVGPEVEEG